MSERGREREREKDRERERERESCLAGQRYERSENVVKDGLAGLTDDI